MKKSIHLLLGFCLLLVSSGIALAQNVLVDTQKSYANIKTIEVSGGQIILTPVRLQRSDAVRAKLAELSISPGDVADALAWARSGTAPVQVQVAEPSRRYEAAAGKKPSRKPASRS